MSSVSTSSKLPKACITKDTHVGNSRVTFRIFHEPHQGCQQRIRQRSHRIARRMQAVLADDMTALYIGNVSAAHEVDEIIIEEITGEQKNSIFLPNRGRMKRYKQSEPDTTTKSYWQTDVKQDAREFAQSSIHRIVLCTGKRIPETITSAVKM